MKTKPNPIASRLNSTILVCSLLLLSIGLGGRSSIAMAEESKSTVDQITKDFLIACEMSKLSINLAKTDPFKADPADLAYRVAEMMSGAFKTEEVKESYKTITNAAPESRVELWHKSAKDLGVKNFKCKTIGFK
ncbi:hypothetical protein BH10BDE1_BH10BDE1_13310 [soil metagenome]